jgi:NADPH-dependent F420 reductase
MKIGILGAGNVGTTLGTRWAKGGHQVVFSSREPDSQKMKDVVAKAGPNSKAASVPDTAKSSEVIALTTPWNAAQDALKEAGNLSGKILIDVLNPLLPDLSGLEVGNTTSAGEMVAGWAKGAKVVKAFNTIGFPVMADPAVNGKPVVMFYCGDDAGAKETVAGLAKELGFDARDAGPLTQARVLEPLALLWISLAMKQGYGTHWGFQVAK